MQNLLSPLPVFAIDWVPVVTTVGILALVLFGLGFVITRFYRKVEQGDALIINKMNTVGVTFSGGVVLPIIHKAEYMDISVKAMEKPKSRPPRASTRRRS